MENGNNTFYGKIILFGEYGIIFDSMALTIPFTHYHGELSFNNKFNKFKYTDYDFANKSNAQLEAYSSYLKKLIDSGQLDVNFDFNAFVKDLDNGLYFESSIPQGFGLGSSGALVASLYDKYVHDNIEGGRSVSKTDILQLKHIFSQMESFFHGKSSGIDPLNSYIQFPLLIHSKTNIETVGIPRNKFNGDSAIFLINTGKPGKTGPLVNLFLENCENEDYFNVITNEFIPLNNACIQNLTNGELEDFFKNLSKLSELQYTYFSDMIPQNFRGIWMEGLETNDYNLKLCGSGGGGYLLGFTSNLPKAQANFAEKEIDIVTVYKTAKS
jgi:mevalonate kinase